jgi:hypothetical protein
MDIVSRNHFVPAFRRNLGHAPEGLGEFMQRLGKTLWILVRAASVNDASDALACNQIERLFLSTVKSAFVSQSRKFAEAKF